MSDILAKAMAKARALWQDGQYQQSVEVMQSLGNSDLPPQVTSYHEMVGSSGALHPAAGGQHSLICTGAAQQANGQILC
jgi:hypothetical protein